MTERVVVDHHHDPDGGVYRLVIGTPIEIEHTKMDDNGEPVLSHVPLHGPDGKPAHDVDGKPIIVHGPPATETHVEYVDQEDFIWDADADEFKGKTAKQIAEFQRQAVKKALAERERNRAEIEASVGKRKSIGSVGETL